MARYLDNSGLTNYDTKIKDFIRAEKFQYRNNNAATLVANGTTHFNVMNVYANMLDFEALADTYKKFDLVVDLTFVMHGSVPASANYSIQLQGCNYSAELPNILCINKIYDHIGLQFGFFWDDPYEGNRPVIRTFAPASVYQHYYNEDAAIDCYINRVYERTADFIPESYNDEYQTRESGSFGEMLCKPSPITFGLLTDAVDHLPDSNGDEFWGRIYDIGE